MPTTYTELPRERVPSREEDELSEARWFSRDKIPADHSGISLTGEMIEYFRKNGPIR